MLKKRVIISTLFLLCLLGTAASAQNTTLQTYTWKHFQFTYPDYWSIVEDKDIENMRRVQLVVNEESKIRILLSLMEHSPKPDDEYRKMPVRASVALGIPLALRLAGKYGESAIAVSYGSIELAYGWTLSARFTIVKSDINDYHSVECFHYLSDDGMAYHGILLSKGPKDRILENPTYYQYVVDAYTIIRSIIIKQ